ncbi:hypothetical protein SNE32_18300, partial [Lysobacter sp. D1-1-M9]|uniref:hypothetical protein n=1 Tax=Novilysobacter longmucuonensis TaxID=3098603 RepID=UPI002FCAFB05
GFGRGSLRPAFVRRISGGEWAIPVLSHPIHWLPCAVTERRVEATSWTDPSGFSIAHDDFEYDGVLDRPELFVIDGAIAVPRYGLRLDDIAIALQHLSPASSDFTCEAEDIDTHTDLKDPE